MQNISQFLSLVLLASFITVTFGQSAQAQSARKFGKKVITVRLCPKTCQAVNGHGYKPGGSAKVYETRAGWARVSGYLDRSKLVGSFGDKITAKPALWVPLSALAPVAKAKRPAAKKKVAAKKTPRATPRRVNVVRQLARLRNVPVPDFRPGSAFVSTTSPVAETTAVAETKPAVADTVPTVEAKPEVVESKPVATQSQSTGSSAGLTWEQVQARIKAQQSAEKAPAKPEEPKAAEAPKAEEINQAAKLEEARIAREKAEAARVAEEARKKAEEAEAARVADEAKKKEEAEAKRLAEEAEAKRLAEEAEAKRKEEAAKAAEAAQKAAEAAAAKETEQAAAKTATPTEQPKTEEVKLPPAAPKETEEATPAVEEPKTEVAAVLPPTKPETPEPVFKSANADPIVFGARPKKLTKALLDKRLRKLPGRKSKVPRKIVIALRHYALGLLNSGECTGISKGGPSAVPGMLYISCTEDPTYLRQFPIEEESW